MLYLASFTKHHVSRIFHVVVGIGTYSPSKVKNTLHFVIHLSMDGHLGCFFLWAMVNSVAPGMGL